MHSGSSRGPGVVVVVALGLLACAATALAAGRAPSKATIRAQGGPSFKINQYVKDSVHFVPGTTTIRSGGTITLRNTSEDPHTLSLVRRSDLPRRGSQIENCKICEKIARGHGIDPMGPMGPMGPPPKPLVDVGLAGFDRPGDSIFVGPKGPGGRASFRVTARRGTTLYFLCAIHPWMQGRLLVR